MALIKFRTNASFSKTFKYIENILNALERGEFDKYGKMGVEALSSATPKDTGKTESSWDYSIIKGKNGITLQWYNTNEVDGVNIAVILQYGHGTKNGGYVKGIDYINPAMKPVFESISKNLWEEVKP